MNILNALRTVDAEASGNVRARLNFLGYQPNERRLSIDEAFLRFIAEFEDGSEMTGYISRTSWLKQALPELQGIDWLSVDDQILPLLVAEVPLKIDLNFQHSPMKQSRAVEVVNDTTGRLSQLPHLVAASGAVLVENLVLPNSDEFSTLTSELDAKLPIPLTFCLGISVLPVYALSAIHAGDVLLIQTANGQVKSHNKIIFKFELGQESIMMVENNEELESEEMPQRIQEGSVHKVKSGVNDLPIELTFVLLEKTVSLGELKQIVPGEVLPLPSNALMEVEIRANQRCFARGELIQLSNGQLGVEVRKMWN